MLYDEEYGGYEIMTRDELKEMLMADQERRLRRQRVRQARLAKRDAEQALKETQQAEDQAAIRQLVQQGGVSAVSLGNIEVQPPKPTSDKPGIDGYTIYDPPLNIGDAARLIEPHMGTRWTIGQILYNLRVIYGGLGGRIPTQSQVEWLCKIGKLCSWSTLLGKLGPRNDWEEIVWGRMLPAKERNAQENN